MRSLLKYLLTFALFAAPPLLLANTMYVIDKLVLGMHEEKSHDSTLVKALPTGTPLEVLQRDGKYAKVRAPDGSSGWVDASYLMKDKPAQIVILELEDKFRRSNEALAKANKTLKKMRTQLEKLEGQIKNKSSDDTKKQLAALEEQNQELKEQLAKASTVTNNDTDNNEPLQKEIDSLRASNTALKQRIDTALMTLGKAPEQITPSTAENSTTEASLSWKWIIILILGALAIGVVGGMKLIDHLNLKRHGGFII